DDWKKRLSLVSTDLSRRDGVRRGVAFMNKIPEDIPGKKEAVQELKALEAEHAARVREMGVLARLECQGTHFESLPLETKAGLEKGRPRLEGGKLVLPTKEAVRAREREMVKQLPTSGLAVLILGANHDLAVVLGNGTEYLRVEVQAVVDARK